MDTPPLPNGNGNGKSWKRVSCVAMLWVAYIIALCVIAADGFPERGWELLSNWLPWNVAITAAFIGVDSIPKLTKP